MQTTTHAVGIDLGTTYSCIAYLNEHGEPVTLANQEGELATPSVVMFDDGEPVVGTEALRNAIVRPHEVVQNSKRFIGDQKTTWTISGKKYTPVDIAALVLKKLIGAAQEQIGTIEQAVITVPAQFSDAQRHATMEAGHRAGLQRVDIINEPVAAALCYVLGTEGLWFSELADEQRILVYDLGGGTFDLSLVRYQKNEVSVVKSSGDLNLGGIDWTKTLVSAIAEQFVKEYQADPRNDPESLQFLSLEAEQTKRSLTVRPKAAMTCQHDGQRKTYQVMQTQFEKLTKPLVDRTVQITEDMLRDEKGKIRWAQVDVVLTTGGSSRMPMIRNKLKEMSGTTINTSLSPDQSIAHGATYYAGMLLSNNKFAKSILNEKATKRLASVRQRSVNARALGIMVRDVKTNSRFPHYMLPENTPLPTDITQNYGTVRPNQRRVRLEIVESGTLPETPPVVLGTCVIEDLPPNLPAGSEIAVTISYDSQARVHVSAKDVTSGKMASAEIIRQENLVNQLESFNEEDSELVILPDPAEDSPMLRLPEPAPPARSSQQDKVSSSGQTVKAPPQAPSGRPVPRPNPPAAATQKAPPQPAPRPTPAPPAPAGKTPSVRPAPRPRPVPQASGLEQADRPIPLCNKCGEPLDARGKCTGCGALYTPRPASPQAQTKKVAPKPPQRSNPAALPPINDDEIIELGPPTNSPPKRVVKKVVKKGEKPASPKGDPGEEDFFRPIDIE